MALKYVVDAALIAIFAGVFWTPVDYLLPMITFNAEKMARFPQGAELRPAALDAAVHLDRRGR